MKRGALLLLAIFGVFLASAAVAFAEDDSALDQLQDMQNTGVTFDGSDGNRSGMDIDVQPVTGVIPEPPAPTPVEIDPAETEPVPLTMDPIEPEPMVAWTPAVDVDTTTYSGAGAVPSEEEPAEDTTEESVE